MAKKKSRRAKGDLLTTLDRAHAATDDARIRELLHELHVHSEEITVQNEQLIRAQVDLEQARDRYADLYDLAPIGYVTVDINGIISDINIIGAELLGHERAFLDGVPIFMSILGDDRARLRQFLVDCSRERIGQPPQVDVRTRREPRRVVRFLARSVITEPGRLKFFVAMLDVTEEQRLAAERRVAFEEAERRAAELSREIKVRVAAEERIKMLLERLVTVQEEERRRIAQNLHDHLGQQLTALRLTVSSLKDHPSAAVMRQRIETIDGIVTQLDQDVDRLAWDLRPAALDDMGLDAALAELLRQWSSARGVPAQLHVSSPTAERLPAYIESQLYRIVQEALHNIGKHANATEVDVMIDRRLDQVILTVEDNGRGFNPELSASSRGRHAGMGLVGMQERAALIGGEVQFESSPGEGTTVFVRIPLKS